MEFFIEHAPLVTAMLLAILALHILEHIFRRRAVLSVIFSVSNFFAHIFLTVVFILLGAEMEQLLLVLLLSLAAGLVRRREA